MRTYRLPFSASCIAKNIYLRYALIVSKDSSIVSNEDEYSHITKQIAEVINGRNKQWGCLFAGNVGNGKTSMLRAVQIFYLDLVLGGIDKAEGLRLITSLDVADRVFKPELWKAICTEPILGIDDMGTEPLEVMQYGLVRNPMSELLQYRYENHLLTFITTNLTPKERLEKYGLRIADRMKEMFCNIVFTHKSYR